MMVNHVLTRKYRKTLKKFLDAHCNKDNGKSEPVIFSDKKEMLRIQILQLLNIIGNVVKTDSKGSFVYDPEQYPLTWAASDLIKLL